MMFANKYFVFLGPANIFLNVFHRRPLQKINGPSFTPSIYIEFFFLFLVALALFDKSFTLVKYIIVIIIKKGKKDV